MPFDLSMTKLLVLAVIAVIVFGPDKLPQVARDAGRVLRQLRDAAQQARTDLNAELGDTLGDFDIADLNPKVFARRHLFDDEPGASAPAARISGAMGAAAGRAVGSVGVAAADTGRPVTASDLPLQGPVPFDADAT